MSKHLLTPDRERTTDKITRTTKVHFGETMNFIVIDGKSEITRGQLLPLMICPSTPDKN